MAELLAKFLQCPEDWKSLPDLKSSTPPETISHHDWSLRHELPLHLINFLRDEAEPLLSLSQSSGATPGKTNRPAKYDYNSPLKTVLESPNKQKPSNFDNITAAKKSKKKVSLFPAKSGIWLDNISPCRSGMDNISPCRSGLSHIDHQLHPSRQSSVRGRLIIASTHCTTRDR